MKHFAITLVLTLFLIFSCTKEDNSESSLSESDWIVDEIDVTGQLALYPLSINPKFDSVKNIELKDGVLVGVINFGSQAIIYPYVFTFENEVINDEYNGRKYAFTYCPITKSALAFTRTEVFRASGYLYKNNLTPWDDETETIWSQMLIKGIKGDKKNKRFNTIPVLETTWGTAKAFFPGAKVLAQVPSLNKMPISTFNKIPPDYEDNNDSSEGLVPNDGEHVYGIIDGFSKVHIFKYSDFPSKVIFTNIGNQDYVIVGNSGNRFINAFKVDDSDNYEILVDELPFVIKNKKGIKYNILGVGTDGSILNKPKYAYVAAWWAWEDFYSSFNFVNKE